MATSELQGADGGAMGLKVIAAVLASNLEPPLRLLAVTLAYHANDPDGTEIRPGVATLMHETRLAESTIRERLSDLVKTGVLVRDGKHRGHTRKYRLDLHRLATYQVESDAEEQVTSQNLRRAVGTEAHKPTPGHRFDPLRAYTRPEAVLRPTIGDPTPGDNRTYARPQQEDPEDPEQPEEITGVDTPEAAQTTPNDPASSPDLYTLAQRAFEQSLRERNDTDSNISEIARGLCASQGLPYDEPRIRDAVVAARSARDKERDAFLDRWRATQRRLGGPSGE